MKFLLSVLGVVLVIEGIPWFLSPGRAKELLRRVAPLPEGSLRALGLTLMILGLLLVYLGTR